MSISLEAVRYVPADEGKLAPNQFEFNKAGKLVFEKPLAGYVRQCLEREIDASGFTAGASGKKLTVAITRAHLADNFTNLELYLEMTWKLEADGKTVEKKLRASRKHFVYGSQKKAEDLNAMITELYENFFTDPEVKPLLMA